MLNETYNYKYLDAEDKNFIDGMWWSANMVVPYIDIDDFDSVSETLSNIKGEISTNLLNNIRERIGWEVADVIVSMIDNIDEDEFESRKEKIDKAQAELGDIQIGDYIYDCDGECYGRVRQIETEGTNTLYYMEDYLCPVSDFNDEDKPILIDDGTQRALWYIRRKNKSTNF